MATLTYSVKLLNPSDALQIGVFDVTTASPFKGVNNGIPVLSLNDVPAMLVGAFNGGTLQPAGAGRILYTTNNFYWSYQP